MRLAELKNFFPTPVTDQSPVNTVIATARGELYLQMSFNIIISLSAISLIVWFAIKQVRKVLHEERRDLLVEVSPQQQHV
jgi:hypothetical protein